MEVEICCGDIQSVLAAKQGGATRIELCSALSDGGVTPSIGVIKAAIATGIPGINVLVRPRPGDFLYSDEEISIMIKDIESAVIAGATGIVIGALDKFGNIDFKTTHQLIIAAKEINPDINITFHRAFDLSNDALKSLDTVISLGCNCLLTSGMASSALAGKETLKQLVERAEKKIVIMAGGGINPDNAREIIDYANVDAIHASARSLIKSDMIFHREELSMGVPENDEYCRLSTDSRIVNNLIKIALNL